MFPRARHLSLPVVLALGALSHGALGDEPPKAAPEPPKSLRKPRPAPTVVEVINLGGDRDPQGFAMGGEIGSGFLYTRGSRGQLGFDMSLTADFGLGEGGKRVPWSIEPFLAFAVTYNLLTDVRGYPNRFTEIGARVVYRFESGPFEHQWLSLGAGVVWTSRRPSSGFFHPSGACRADDRTKANELGLDCSRDDQVAPGALLDLGVGVYEWTIRRARWGFAARLPIQLSSTPGFAAIGVFYAQIGTIR